MSPTFFISYRSRQVHLAHWVDRLIQSMGFATWIQAEDFEAGVDFTKNMLIGATKDWCIAVVTEDYFDSRYTCEEWDQAVRSNKLIPLCFAPEGSEAEKKSHARLPDHSKHLALVNMYARGDTSPQTEKSGSDEDASPPAKLYGIPGHIQAARVERAIFQRLAKRTGFTLTHPSISNGQCVTNLRDLRHRFFFDRPGASLAKLKATLADERANGQRMVVVRGPAGVGKSWLAEHCGWQLAAADFEAVMILRDASSPERIDESLSELSDWFGAECSPEVMPTVQQRARAVLDWLRNHRRWLVIADDVNSEASRQELQSRFADGMQGGNVLIVTRQTWTDAAATFPQVQLSFLNADDGAAFLLTRLDIRSPTELQRQNAIRVAVEFGGVPEALEWIAKQALRARWKLENCAAHYHAEWRERLRVESHPTLSRCVNNLSGPARWLLEVLSQTYRHGIPLGVVASLAPDSALLSANCHQAVAEIDDIGLCDISPGTGLVRGNRIALSTITADWVNHSLNQTERRARRRSLCTAINSYLFSRGTPVDKRSWQQWQELLPLLRHLWKLASEDGWWPEAMLLAANCACYLVETGRLQETHSLLAELDSSGIDSAPAEIHTMHLQAQGRAALETGDFAKAASCFDKAANLLPPAGTEHALMLGLRANALRELARVEESSPQIAELLYRAALSCPSLRRTEMIQLHSNLAMCLADMGRGADALRESTRAMLLAEQDFGADHPITAAILTNHATLLPCPEANLLLRRALAILDTCHQGTRNCTADVLINLAAKHCGNTAEVSSWLARAVSIYRRNLGPHHVISNKLATEIETVRELLDG